MVTTCYWKNGNLPKSKFGKLPLFRWSPWSVLSDLIISVMLTISVIFHHSKHLLSCHGSRRFMWRTLYIIIEILLLLTDPLLCLSLRWIFKHTGYYYGAFVILSSEWLVMGEPGGKRICAKYKIHVQNYAQRSGFVVHWFRFILSISSVCKTKLQSTGYITMMP